MSARALRRSQAFSLEDEGTQAIIFIPCSNCRVSHGRCVGLNQCSVFMVSAQLAFNKMSPISSTRDQTASKPGLATCFLLQQTLLTAGRYRAFREEQSNQSTFRTMTPVQLSSEICSLGQLPKGLHQLCFVLALGTSKVGDVLRREICLPRRKSPWEERRDGCPWNRVGQSHGGRGETGLEFSTAALRMCVLVWRFLGVTKALEGNLHLLFCQQEIIACPSLVPPPALATSTFIRNLTVFFGWISPENPILRLPSDC